MFKVEGPIAHVSILRKKAEHARVIQLVFSVGNEYFCSGSILVQPKIMLALEDLALQQLPDFHHWLIAVLRNDEYIDDVPVSFIRCLLRKLLHQDIKEVNEFDDIANTYCSPLKGDTLKNFVTLWDVYCEETDTPVTKNHTIKTMKKKPKDSSEIFTLNLRELHTSAPESLNTVPLQAEEQQNEVIFTPEDFAIVSQSDIIFQPIDFNVVQAECLVP